MKLANNPIRLSDWAPQLDYGQADNRQGRRAAAAERRRDERVAALGVRLQERARHVAYASERDHPYALSPTEEAMVEDDLQIRRDLAEREAVEGREIVRGVILRFEKECGVDIDRLREFEAALLFTFDLEHQLRSCLPTRRSTAASGPENAPLAAARAGEADRTNPNRS